MYGTWKGAEREICRRLGIRRTGHLGGADGSGAWLSVEVKHRKKLPGWLHAAMAQARGHAQEGQLPLVALHELRQQYSGAYIVMTLADFVDHFGTDPGQPLAGLEDAAGNGDRAALAELRILAPERAEVFDAA